MSQNCRFCLRNLGYNEKFHEIDDEIKSNFCDLTQHALITSDIHTNIVCELCLRSLQLASTLKKQLIQNQENFFKHYEHNPYDFNQPKSYAQVMFVNLDGSKPKVENRLNTNEFSSTKQIEKPKSSHSEVEHICRECGKHFKTIDSLKMHMMYHDDPEYKCDFCSKKFFQKLTLKQHIRITHLNRRDYRCHYCPKTYSENSSLKRHINSMHKEHKFVCGVQSCLNSFNYKHHCKLHIQRKHHNIKPEEIDNFITYSVARSPNSSQECFKDWRNYYCRFCLKNLGCNDKFHEIDDEIKSDFSDLTNHELILSDGHMNIVCELCLRSLQLASTLKKQLIENQENFFKHYERDPFDFNESKSHAQVMFVNFDGSKPKVENKSNTDEFSSTKQIETPKSSHSEGENICRECGKQFKTIDSLKMHMTYHDDPEYKCDSCSKKFFQKLALKQHIRIAHLNGKDYSCHYCSKIYSEKSTLKRHINSMHKEQKFICGVESCLISFNYKHHCKLHIQRKHHHIKPEEIDNFITCSVARSSNSSQECFKDWRD